MIATIIKDKDTYKLNPLYVGTQSQARWQLDNWERYIVGNWYKWSFVMQDIAMYQRSRLLKQLLKLQMKEFER